VKNSIEHHPLLENKVVEEGMFNQVMDYTGTFINEYKAL
jgi:hypothetical protein